MAKSLKKQRAYFWHQDPRCYYCGVETILKDHHKKNLYTLEERDRLATVDHLRPRHHPDRLEPANGERRHVLSCWRCNNDRDKRELAEKPREWFEQNGGAMPLHKRSIEDLEAILAKFRYIVPSPKPSRRFRERANRAKRDHIAVLWAWFEKGTDGASTEMPAPKES